MSVSSHLSPEPERRLWLILEMVRGEADRAEWLLAALAAICALEAFAVPAARTFVTAAGAFSVLSLLPVPRKPRRVPFLDPELSRPGVDDSLVSFHDIAKYALGDLILKLDRYLGGGVTNTQYYEDIVAEIVHESRRAARKRRLFGAACFLTALAQLALIAALHR